MKTNIIICGHICLDLIPVINKGYSCLDEVLIEGGLTNVGPIILSGGGPVFNVGSALSKMIDFSKYNLFLIGKTGEDYLSEILEKLAKLKGIQLILKKEKKLTTSYTIAIANNRIDRSYLHNPGANDFFSSGDVFFPKKGCPGVFHFGYPQLMKRMFNEEGELLSLFLKAKKEGYTTSIDMSLVSETSDAAKKDWKKILKRVLPHVDMLFIGMEEAHFIYNSRDYFRKKRDYKRKSKDILGFYDEKRVDIMKDFLFGLGANLIILKSGKKGAFLFSKNHVNRFSRHNWNNLKIKEFPKKTNKYKNSIGAGDNFAAGFIKSCLVGESPINCLRNGIDTATHSLSFYGGS